MLTDWTFWLEWLVKSLFVIFALIDRLRLPDLV